MVIFVIKSNVLAFKSNVLLMGGVEIYGARRRADTVCLYIRGQELTGMSLNLVQVN